MQGKPVLVLQQVATAVFAVVCELHGVPLSRGNRRSGTWGAMDMYATVPKMSASLIWDMLPRTKSYKQLLEGDSKNMVALWISSLL